MNILVTFATAEEFAPWRRHHAFSKIKIAELEIYRARFADTEVSILLTGIGPANSGANMLGVCMLRASQDGYFDSCISTGLAGSLRAEHHPCHVLAARTVRTGQVHQDLRSDSIASDPVLLEVAENSGARIVEAFFTSDHIVAGPQEKAKLAKFADAVEMESFDILKEVNAFGARAIAIRAISDGFDEELPLDFSAVLTRDGKVSASRVIGQVARKPGRIPSLLAFARQSRRAATALADFLDRYIAAVSKSNVQPRRMDAEEVSAT